APALGYFDGLVAVWQGDTLHQVRAARHVIATGTVEQPLVFANNDLPGVMLAGGARRLGAVYAVAAGRRAVVAATDEAGLDAPRPGVFVLEHVPATMFAAGAVVGHTDPDAAEISGAVAGARAAGAGDADDEQALLALHEARIAELHQARVVAPPPAMARDRRRRAGKAFVDLDEDVTVKDVAHAAAEGYDSIELSKRYT